MTQFKFIDFAPEVFSEIRKFFGITEQEYMSSLGPEQVLAAFFHKNFDYIYQLCSTGKSGSLLYFTKDRNYMMKEIHEEEFEKLRNILKPYYEYLTNNKETLVSRFFGLHKVIWKDGSNEKKINYIVIMNNVFKFKDFEIGIRFDLKGSSEGRSVLSEGRRMADHCLEGMKTALKCNDWRKHINTVTFAEASNNRKFIDVVESDGRFLKDCGVMDYSLLIGEVLALSDNTKIQNVPWSVLKKHVMEPNPNIKKLLSAEEL